MTSLQTTLGVVIRGCLVKPKALATEAVKTKKRSRRQDSQQQDQREAFLFFGFAHLFSSLQVEGSPTCNVGVPGTIKNDPTGWTFERSFSSAIILKNIRYQLALGQAHQEQGREIDSSGKRGDDGQARWAK